MLSGLPPGFEARAAEDTLCYRIGAGVAPPLLDRARSRELLVGVHEPAHQPVATLIRAPTVRCEPMQSIREVARQMTAAERKRERSSTCAAAASGSSPTATSARGSSPPGCRLSAAGRRRDDLTGVLGDPRHARWRGAVRAARSRDPPCARGLRARRTGRRDRGRDLPAVSSRSWFGVRRAIARAQSADSLVTVAQRLPQTAADLHASSIRALEVARVLSALVDAITVRALELAAPRRELPADGIVWVAVGSQARRELTPASNASGALVCSEPPPQRWIEAVSKTLQACGLSRDVIAHTPQEWAQRNGGDELALTVLVERRPLWGTPRDPLPVADGPVRDRVLAALADRALAYSPPTGFDPDRVLELDGTSSDRLDIRRAAVVPIVELARWAGSVAGLVAGSTPERLQAGADAGALDAGDAASLTEAFELALELRIAHHVQQLARGMTPDDQIETASISPLTPTTCATCSAPVTAAQRRLRG